MRMCRCCTNGTYSNWISKCEGNRYRLAHPLSIVRLSSSFSCLADCSQLLLKDIRYSSPVPAHSSREQPGPPVNDYRGWGTPSHRLGRIHPYVRSCSATGTDRERSGWRTSGPTGRPNRCGMPVDERPEELSY